MDWDNTFKKKLKQIKELAWKGVPNTMRSLLWPMLAGIDMANCPLKEKYPKLLGVRNWQFCISAHINGSYWL